MSLLASYLLFYALFSFSRASHSADTVVSWWSVDHEFESKTASCMCKGCYNGTTVKLCLG